MRDVDKVIQLVTNARPEVRWDQLAVSHPADNDGIWFFYLPGSQFADVQIESSDGTCPFLVEWGGEEDRRRETNTPEETAEVVLEWLNELRLPN